MKFDRYEIRLINEKDAAAFYSLVTRNRKRLEDFFALTVASTKTMEDTTRFVIENIKKAADKSYFPFVITDDGNTLLGYVDVKGIDWRVPKAEIGYFIEEKYAGRGITGKAVALVIDHLFNDHGFVKLFLRTHVSNTASRRLAEKCGFELEGIIRSDYKTTKGELMDLMYYGLLKPGNE